MIYVSDPADAGKIKWGRCELANERNFMKYWNESIFPSIKALDFNDLSNSQAPVLTIHGMKDRSAPYGGGREWATMLPNALAEYRRCEPCALGGGSGIGLCGDRDFSRWNLAGGGS